MTMGGAPAHRCRYRPYVPVGDLRLHVREWGPSTAPPILLLHGIMEHARVRDVVTAALATDHRSLLLAAPICS